MPRVVLAFRDWQAVAHELAAAHTAASPPGLLERVHALLAQAPNDWSDQTYALEVDEAGAEAIRATHAFLTGADAGATERAAGVAEAVAIIRDHQQRY